MLFVPIAFVGSSGGGSDAPSFDVTYSPSAARAIGDRQPSIVGHVALRGNPAAPASTLPVARSGAASSTESAGSALAEASAKIEAVPVATTTTTTVAAKARVAAPSKTAPSSSPLAINLPLNLGETLRNLTGQGEHGEASWFDAPAGTCAHQTLPFGTLVKVTSLHDGTSTTCEVDDRGPFIDGRVIDLSHDTFEKLAHPGSGVIDVSIEW